MTYSDFDWSQGDVCGDETFKADAFGRAQYATFLTNLLINKSQSGNYVLNLNSEWGSGKTYFIKRWAKELKDNHPVIYIDAWQQDYSDDPLLTVISSIIEQLKEQAGPGFQQKARHIVGKAFSLFKAATPVIAAGLLKKSTGVDFKEVADAASAVVTQLIKDHEDKGKSIEALKLAVGEWIQAVIDLSKGEIKSPAFIFIDELDRCRPSYAVEMLETIKHIFNIPNTVFVIATDTDQLQHSIKVIYGEEFEAGKYLGRFFNARYALNRPSFDSYFNSVYGQEFNGNRFDNIHLSTRYTPVIQNLSIISGAFFKSVRDATKVMDRFIAILDNLDVPHWVNIYYIFILLCIYEKRHQDFYLLTSEIILLNRDNTPRTDWFSKCGEVIWDKKVTVKLSNTYLSQLLPEHSRLIDTSFSNEDEINVEIDQLFFLVSNVLQHRTNKLQNVINNILAKANEGSNYDERRRTITPLEMISDDYIKLVAFHFMDRGITLKKCLDLVTMSHSFETFN